MDQTTSTPGPRLLFLDDDPARAATFLESHPDAVWVRDARGCIDRLAEPWDEVHLDHDLGGRTHVDMDSDDCGMEVVRWLRGAPRPHLKGTRFVVHSRNANAACVMVLHLEEAGYPAVARPFPRARTATGRSSPARRGRAGVAADGGRLAGRAAEGVAIALACLAPWAFGSVDAWAQLGLWVLIGALALLGLISGRLPAGRSALLCPPSLALGGLAILATLQAVPVTAGAIAAVAPDLAALRTALAPERPQGVASGAGRPVAPPAPTLSVEPDASAGAAAMLLAGWVLLQGVLALRDSPGAFRRLATAMAVVATALSCFAIVQALTWSGKIYGVRPSPILGGWYTGGPFVCHNHLAASLNLGLGCALGLLLSSDRSRRGRGLLPAYMVGVITLGILGSHSRGGFLAMASAAAVILALVRAGGRARAALIGSVLLVGAALVVVGGDSSLGRLGTIWEASLGGFNGRAEVWRASVPAWRLSPWLGTGLGGFAASVSPFLDRNRGVYFSHAENEYIQLLVEGGVVGLGLGLLGLVGALRLGWATVRATKGTREQALYAGGLFGLVALAIQSLADFPLHIPGVALPAVVLFGSLIRPGLVAVAEPAEARRRGAWFPGGLRACVGVGVAALAAVGTWRTATLARAEAAVLAAGLPSPGAASPTGQVGLVGPDALARRRAGIEAALRLRPDWAEGHIRLAETHLALYGTEAAGWLGSAVEDPREAEALADPLWLHGIVHADPAASRGDSSGLLELEPIRDHLIPAARCLLEARRCSPLQPIVHARLGMLDYLLDPAEPAPVHAGRALRLAGSDPAVADLAARVASQAGDRDLAARAWRRAVEVGLDDASWEAVAEATAEALSPEQLETVLESSGRDTLRFALRLFGGDADREARERFLRVALDRLPEDARLTPAERLWHQGVAWAYLGEGDRAADAMRRAIRADARRKYWREEYAAWLVRWGEYREAERVARVALAIEPNSPGARQALRSALEALTLRSDNSEPELMTP
jgi:O-antigen ligase